MKFSVNNVIFCLAFACVIATTGYASTGPVECALMQPIRPSQGTSQSIKVVQLINSDSGKIIDLDKSGYQIEFSVFSASHWINVVHGSAKIAGIEFYVEGDLNATIAIHEADVQIKCVLLE